MRRWIVVICGSFGVGLMAGMVITRMTLDITNTEVYPAIVSRLEHQSINVQESFEIANRQFVSMEETCKAWILPRTILELQKSSTTLFKK